MRALVLHVADRIAAHVFAHVGAMRLLWRLFRSSRSLADFSARVDAETVKMERELHALRMESWRRNGVRGGRRI